VITEAQADRIIYLLECLATGKKPRSAPRTYTPEELAAWGRIGRRMETDDGGDFPKSTVSLDDWRRRSD